MLFRPLSDCLNFALIQCGYPPGYPTNNKLDSTYATLSDSIEKSTLQARIEIDLSIHRVAFG